MLSSRTREVHMLKPLVPGLVFPAPLTAQTSMALCGAGSVNAWN